MREADNEDQCDSQNALDTSTDSIEPASFITSIPAQASSSTQEAKSKTKKSSGKMSKQDVKRK